MHTDFFAWLEQHKGREYDLHNDHINPAFVKMLKTIGFDKGYVRGEGAYLWDEDGNKYLDLLTGWGVFALGRNHPKVKAILQQLLTRDMPNLVRMECSLLSGLVAEMLTKHTSENLTRVFFCNSGTETIETSIKFARCATGRQGIIYCDHAFHGLTTGSLALNGSDFFRSRFGEMMPGAKMIPFNDLEALEKALSTKQAAAFIVEPVQGKTCEVVHDGYLAEAQQLCRKYGTLLVVDEVQCGLGRTGKWFAYQHWPEVEPDIVCVAKALSGGFVPVGAVITRPRIMDCVFDSMERCVVHSNTFGQNDMAMAAALASLYVIEEDKLVENAATVGERTIKRLRELAKSCPFVSEIRGKGLMFGIDFARPKENFKLKMAWDMLHKLNFGVFGQMLVIPLLQKHRILTQVAGFHIEVIKFLPPMTVSQEDMDWFLGAMEEVLADTQRFPGAAWETVTGLAKRTIRT
ncbi:MAG: Acetylornithine transaminase [Phycisphaerales bacterium]|jgi:ornithine--oxo-acid transaminase|nr:Acetylornithine transaminase [Phycisphaerales bacterium]MDB5353978.1 Acetylornithine transaminase [Phycisphaerales bacterium]